MSSGIELSTEQLFHLEHFNRALDATSDPAQLRHLAKQLLQAWQTQKAATKWIIHQRSFEPTRATEMIKSLPDPEP
ncbi:hypothetical protein [Synechococcus sp. UW105]|jgi:3-methyladenine DNA glycosylase AlkC|uniref:hypothetical protein n=1 Tax=unclassified Synechococcus TaxID=2626047 RepID=UPI000E0F63A6|nr:hypothetical protein [Synechococcus sp. UW105]RZO10864.1 MAG: hypothetical protein EVB08_09820 [Synechococcus sp. MED-G135]|tara:strand:- start:525 stop:752 length:228 start_codon:yes stop_codon:yes gene_type:complete